MSDALLSDLIFILLLVALSVPLGMYMYKVMTGQRVFLTKVISPVENSLYKLMGIRDEAGMTPKSYTLSVIALSLAGLIAVFLLQLVQNILPGNPEHMKSISWDLALNTAVSYVTNTNWQAYSGESSLSYFTQSIGLTVQNFLSAGTGIAVLFALIRGFTQKQQRTIGNFWRDLIRVVLYILLPLSLVLAIALASQGVVQTIHPYTQAIALESGKTQLLPLGPAASQVAIKQLGTNGGGFFGANSAYPLENPTALSNLLQLLSILLIPAGLCVSFGKAVNDSKQGRTIYSAMLILFVLCLAGVTLSEFLNAPVFAGVLRSGSMEGKNVINGTATSALWGTATTAASNGSVNAMLDSFTPLSGVVLMFLMHIGEVVFGGVGSGVYGMLGFVILTVFIAGLMVGRTPEYLGKKIEPSEMKLVCIIILIPALMALFGTLAAVLMPQVTQWLNNTGAHGFSEILYAFSSLAANNGSSFAGYEANSVFTNVVGSVMMLVTRFVPMTAVICLAGNLSNKKSVAAGEGTLSTSNGVFVALLIAIILIVGALTFLPALALGPIADYFTAIR